ncbi:MAG: cobalt transporter [Limnothrix sp.]
MKSLRLAGSVLAFGLAFGTPSLVFAHVGHGDEFQAEGGINRVKMNAEMDPLLGIVVEPISPAADGSAAVYIPMTAIVEDGDRQLVFVNYEEFYEPVPVTTGATKGELVEITKGLAAGEKLVIQGSLSLYAESRKSQTAETPAETPDAAETPIAVKTEESIAETPTAVTPEKHGQADAQGVPHGHDDNGDLVVASQAKFPLIKTAIGAVAIALIGGLGIRAFNMSRQGKNFFGE